MPQATYKPRKIFTLEEANRTLPLVSRIILDIVRVHEELQHARRRVKELVEERHLEQARVEEDRASDLAFEVEDLIAELHAIGCECKDPHVGLVDFPARIGGRVVFLCWKMGEEQIRFWHELSAGFAGRKPVQGTFA